MNSDEMKEIENIINNKLKPIQDNIMELSKRCLKIQIFHLSKYGFNDNELNFNANRFFSFNSTLVPEVINAILSNHFVVLEFHDIYWFLNSYEMDSVKQRYNISFINIFPDLTMNNNNNIMTIIQFCILEYNKNLDKNTIFKSSNKINISNTILTDNSIYNNI